MSFQEEIEENMTEGDREVCQEESEPRRIRAKKDQSQENLNAKS